MLLLVLLACGTTAVAIPLDSYHQRVRESMSILNSLQAIDEGTTALQRDENTANALAIVRQLLPPSETVEWDNSSLKVDNGWLETLLQNYEKLSPADANRAVLLTEATERLGAIADALKELESQQTQANNSGSKDEEKARLEAILRREEYAQKAAERSALSRLLDKFLEWLLSLFPKRGPLQPGASNLFSQILGLVVVGLALAVIGYIAWKFGPRLWRGLGQGKKTKKREARVVLGERLEPDQTSADLLAEAEALAREGNLRAAIRKGYIALLCELGDRKVLGLAQHKTNRDYLRAVRDQEQLYREMQVMTSSFENHWYGFIPASMDDWNLFRNHYQQALRQ